MQEAVIVDAVRTPIGRYEGALRSVRPDDLAAHVIKGLLERNPWLSPEEIDDVYFGCANQAGEDNRNVARMAILLAGLPESVPGVTVNRLCASGLEAVNLAAAAIKAGLGEVYIAGGTESMTRAPYVMMKPHLSQPRANQVLYDTTLGWRLVNPLMEEKYPPLSLGETAEKVAERYGITREAQDRFALSSQQKAQQAIREGKFTDEILPLHIVEKMKSFLFDTDEHPRPETTLEELARLKPVFKKGGTVTAGNSSGINDGASALLVMSRQKAKSLGIQPMAKVVTSATAGVHPDYMGIGPVPAVKKVLERTKMTLQDVDLIEINEAFAAQVLACIEILNIDLEKVNVNGGAIALGHPLGCSGARIVTTLLHEMKRRKSHFGLATMCVGVGQGVATLFEQVD